MDWKELTVNINMEAGEALANILEEMGASGLVISEQKDRISLTAYYPDDESFNKVLSRIREKANNLQTFGLKTGKIQISVKETKESDWATSWHKFFKPLKLGDSFLISPSWENCSGDDRIVIEIDPGMAFGIGSHETTQLSLEMMEEYLKGLKDDIDKVNILDIGTGTGILSIAAARMGFIHIVGIDIDQAAVNTARTNCRLNNVNDQVKIVKGDLAVDVVGKYTVIMANLLPDLIERLLPDIPPLLKDNGILILSGITGDKKDKIVSLLHNHGLQAVKEKFLNEWVGLAVRKG